MSSKLFFTGTLSFLIIMAFACGSTNSAPTASPDQYKEVALRYLRALAEGDFNTFIKLDQNFKSYLEAAQAAVPTEPAFDRQQRMQKAMNAAMNYQREQFKLFLNGNDYKIIKLKGATLRVLEVAPLKGELNAGLYYVFIEAQGRERAVLKVGVSDREGELIVWEFNIHQ